MFTFKSVCMFVHMIIMHLHMHTITRTIRDLHRQGCKPVHAHRCLSVCLSCYLSVQRMMCVRRCSTYIDEDII